MDVPEGWKLVPIKATEEMRNAAANTDEVKWLNDAVFMSYNHGCPSPESWRERPPIVAIYEAMISAAPEFTE